MMGINIVYTINGNNILIGRAHLISRGGEIMIDLKYLRGEKGFTLVEMMVVMIIIAVLIAGGIRFYIGYIDRAKITKGTGDIAIMQAALDAYYAGSNAYPGEDDSSLNAAGLSTEMIGSSSIATRSYIYDSDGSPVSTYKIYTRIPLDGTNYVIGSGKNGKSDPIYTSSTQP